MAARFRAERVEQRRRIVADAHQSHLPFAHEAFAHAVGQELQQGVVVAARIEDADRLVVVAELAPGPDLEQLLEGADAAGQGDEGVGALAHHRLALVHGVDDVQLVAQGIGQLLVDQRLGDDSDDAAAGQAGGFRDRAHEAGASAAVDQLAAALADPAAGGLGDLEVARMLARTGAAVDADGKSGIL